MKNIGLLSFVNCTIIAFLMIVPSVQLFAQKNIGEPAPKLITLDQASSASVDILHGSPETVTMRSGYMVLAPSKSVGRHSTKENEEAIVVLAGKGEMKILGGVSLMLHPYCVAYCPPYTEHDVSNTGTDTLRYIYVVARAKK